MSEPGLGWSVWSRVTVDEWGHPKGGVVCEVFDLKRHDPDTGEYLEDVRYYRCREPFGRSVGTITMKADEVDPDNIEPPEPNRIWRLMRHLADFQVKARARRPNAPLKYKDEERQAVTDAYHLLMVVAGEGW